MRRPPPTWVWVIRLKVFTWLVMLFYSRTSRRSMQRFRSNRVISSARLKGWSIWASFPKTGLGPVGTLFYFTIR